MEPRHATSASIIPVETRSPPFMVLDLFVLKLINRLNLLFIPVFDGCRKIASQVFFSQFLPLVVEVFPSGKSE